MPAPKSARGARKPGSITASRSSTPSFSISAGFIRWRPGATGVLVGGLYGVALGAAFFGESMFHHQTDASKVALIHLAGRLVAGGFKLLDTQFVTPHLQSLGAIEVSKEGYRLMLARPWRRKPSSSSGRRKERYPGARFWSRLPPPPRRRNANNRKPEAAIGRGLNCPAGAADRYRRRRHCQAVAGSRAAAQTSTGPLSCAGAASGWPAWCVFAVLSGAGGGAGAGFAAPTGAVGAPASGSSGSGVDCVAEGDGINCSVPLQLVSQIS